MRTSTLLLTILSSLSLTAASPTATSITGQQWPIKAVAVLTGKVQGTVTLIQEDEDSATKIMYEITGNDPNASRGFHIHQYGDLTKGCDRLVRCHFFQQSSTNWTTTARKHITTHMISRTAHQLTKQDTLVTWETSRLMPLV